jgi:hypothetical protein
VFVLAADSSFAQLDNTYLRDEVMLERKDSNLIGTSISLFNYMRNTEYFNNIELGRTLFGYQFQPKLFYQPNDHVKLEAGVFLRNDFGGINPYTQVAPTFTLKIKNDHFSFLFGTLEGALSHRLIEPMYNIEYAITKRLENGAQFKYDAPKQFLDVWINWQNFIERGSPNKEVVTAGISSMTSLYESSSGFKIKLPVQFTVHHHGGQIDTDTLNMTVQINAASGLRISQEYRNRFIKEMRLDAYYTIYHESTNSGMFPFRDGNGVYINGLIRSTLADLMLSYWLGNAYLSPIGSYIYSSQSIDKPSYTEKNRELLFVRFMREQPLFGDIYLTARVEPVYDLWNSIFDYSYSLYLSYKKTFGIKTPGK